MIFGSINYSENCACKAQWCMTGALTLMVIGLIFFNLVTTKKIQNIQRTLFSNAVMVTLFFSNVEHNVPVKLCKTAGSINLFKIIGH